MQRLLVRYAKRGPARFASHRDFGRAFERALRRAAVPVAYSSGFSPHPRISYAGAVATGAASEAEYLEIALAQPCDPEQVRQALAAALPPGFAILEVTPAGSGALADLCTGSRWRIEHLGPDPQVLRAAADRFLAEEQRQVERMTKNGLRTFDARRAVARMVVVGTGLELTLAHHTPLVRPDDVVAALVQIDGRLAAEPPLITRLSQGVLDPATGALTEPI